MDNILDFGKKRLKHYARSFRMDIKNTALFTAVEPHSIGPDFHVHPFWEVKLMLCGTCRWPGLPHSDGIRMTICPPGTPHRAHRGADLSADAFMFIFTENGNWTLHASQTVTSMPMHYGLGNAALRQHLGCPIDDIWAALAAEWPLVAGNAIVADMWRNRIRGLFGAFCLLMEEKPLAPATGPRRRVLAAQSHIRNEYYRSDLTVTSIARLVGCTATHLSSLMRRETGLSVRQVIVRTRLERARELLAEGRYSVKEVAHLTGWRTGFYFSNCFRAFFGVRPSACIPALAGA